jgi:DNA ligase (NAD+)
VSAGSGCLKDLRFVITGSFEELKRSEIAALIKENGGIVSTGISSKIDFLVAGDKAGSKLDKALKLDITVLSIYDLSDMMGRPIC